MVMLSNWPEQNSLLPDKSIGQPADCDMLIAQSEA
jgi:hypothetical protein